MLNRRECQKMDLIGTTTVWGQLPSVSIIHKTKIFTINADIVERNMFKQSF